MSYFLKKFDCLTLSLYTLDTYHAINVNILEKCRYQVRKCVRSVQECETIIFLSLNLKEVCFTLHKGGSYPSGLARLPTISILQSSLISCVFTLARSYSYVFGPLFF